MSSATFACVRCRRVARRDQFAGTAPTCPQCRESMTNMGTRWRPPARPNVSAWSSVARGETLWDHQARTSRWRRRVGGLYRERPPAMDGRR